MLDTPPSSAQLRFRGRSFISLILYPEAPLQDWLLSLDREMTRSPEFFSGKPIILNLDLLSPDTENLASLLTVLQQKNLRIIEIEGDRSWPALHHWDWPQALSGGKDVEQLKLPEPQANATPLISPTLIVDKSIRSGQSISFPEGDVIIIGSVASGSEIAAGGSIHVYGTLRGRAIAGLNENDQARIFALNLQAELMAINGFYITAEEIDPNLMGKTTQTYLQADSLKIELIKQ